MLIVIISIIFPVIFYVLYSLIQAIFYFQKDRRRPFLNCFLVKFLSFPQYLGLLGKSCDVHECIKCAINNTGLKDFGGTNQGWVQRYDVARKVGLERSGGKFSSIGFLVVKQTLTRRIESRLKFVEYLKKNPKVEQVQMKPPIFVIGFPRTGTTYLHELLGTHPRVSSHYSWEQMEPVPRTSLVDDVSLLKDRKERYQFNKPFLNKILYLMGDAIQSIHRIGADETEECTTPCAFELPWFISDLPFMVFACDQILPLGCGDAFPLYRKYLQLLSYQSPERHHLEKPSPPPDPSNFTSKSSASSSGDSHRLVDPFTWMLKCPFHLPYLSSLFSAFPQSTVVWTHRDPSECIASACSLYEVLMRSYLLEETIDRKKIGRWVLKYTELSLNSALSFLESGDPSIKVIHVRYADTVKTCEKIVKDVSTQTGLGWDDECQTALNNYVQDNKKKREQMKKKQGKSGKALHTYTLEEYGLSKEVVRETFKSYIEKFNLDEKVNC